MFRQRLNAAADTRAVLCRVAAPCAADSTGKRIQSHDSVLSELREAVDGVTAHQEASSRHLAVLAKTFGLSDDDDVTPIDLSQYFVAPAESTDGPNGADGTDGVGGANATEADERSWRLHDERTLHRDAKDIERRAAELIDASGGSSERIAALRQRLDKVAEDEGADKEDRMKALMDLWADFERDLTPSVQNTRIMYADIKYAFGRLESSQAALDEPWVRPAANTGDSAEAGAATESKDGQSEIPEWEQALRYRSKDRAAAVDSARESVHKAAEAAAPPLEDTEVLRGQILRLLASLADPTGLSLFNETQISLTPAGSWRGSGTGDAVPGSAASGGAEGAEGVTGADGLSIARGALLLKTQNRVIFNQSARSLIEQTAREVVRQEKVDPVVEERLSEERPKTHERIAQAFNDPDGFKRDTGHEVTPVVTELTRAKSAHSLPGTLTPRRKPSRSASPAPSELGTEKPEPPVKTVFGEDGVAEVNDENFDLVARHVHYLSELAVPQLQRHDQAHDSRLSRLEESTSTNRDDLRRLADAVEPSVESLARDGKATKAKLAELEAMLAAVGTGGGDGSGVDTAALGVLHVKMSEQASQIEKLFADLEALGRKGSRRPSMDSSAFRAKLDETAAQLAELLQKQRDAESDIDKKLKLKANISELKAVHSVVNRKVDEDTLHTGLQRKLDRDAMDKLLEEYLSNLDSRLGRLHTDMRDERQAEVDELRRKFKAQLRNAIHKALSDAGVAGYNSNSKTRFGRQKLEFCAGCDRPVDDVVGVPVPTAIHGRLPTHPDMAAPEEFVFRGGGFRVPSKRERLHTNEMGLEVHSVSRPRSAASTRGRGRPGSAPGSEYDDVPATPIMDGPRSGVDSAGRPRTAPAAKSGRPRHRPSPGGYAGHSTSLANSGSSTRFYSSGGAGGAPEVE